MCAVSGPPEGGWPCFTKTHQAAWLAETPFPFLRSTVRLLARMDLQIVIVSVHVFGMEIELQHHPPLLKE